MLTLEDLRRDFTPDQVDFYGTLQFLSKDRQTLDLKSQASFIVSLERSINAAEPIKTRIINKYLISFDFDSALTFKCAEEDFEEFFEDNPLSNLTVMRKNVLGYFGLEKINWEEFNSCGVEYKVAKFPKNPNAYLVRTLLPGSIPDHNVLRENIVVAPNEDALHEFWQAVIKLSPQPKAA